MSIVDEAVPYKDAVSLTLRFACRSMAEGEKEIHVAPTTLVDGDMLPDVAALDLMFKPELGEMNSLALPDNLALPNLANLSFGGGTEVRASESSISTSEANRRCHDRAYQRTHRTSCTSNLRPCSVSTYKIK